MAAATIPAAVCLSCPYCANGTLGTPTTIQHTGNSADKERLKKPHVHSTVFSPDGKYIFVSDLGIDKVMIYSLTQAVANPNQATDPFEATTPGSGPRHFTFHPNGKLAYLVEEMGGAVSAFKYKDGRLTQVQHISTYPANYTGKKWSADIHISPDGRFLYATNRTPANTIEVFTIDTQKRTIKTIGS